MKRIQKAATGVVVLLSALVLGACSTDGYGRAGVSVGHGHYGGYGYDYPYSSGYGNGWYNGYYYPGNGYYVFDRAGKRHRWTSHQRDYWSKRGHDRPRYSGPRYDRDRDRDHARDRVGHRDDRRWGDRNKDNPRVERDRAPRPQYARPDRDRRDGNRRPERGGHSRDRPR
ncbi:hypothetical protein [Sphingosinicella soli]|uniref:Peptidase n=1 Tax=Sphingosinicella soli TaxID=333708 RepID=A0A7W7F6X6_9SPHN|nr:hypothetical protein [Sphingosinicella soli]MBB4632796.1 hypothetical protein [Sphingosinicella soli]